MQSFVQDLRYAARALLKSPGFALVAVITLGLGIGVNTTIFSAVNTMMLRPFPYREPERLVGLREDNTKNGCEQCSVSYANFADWREASRTLSGAAAYGGRSFNLADQGEEPERLDGTAASASLFRVLGIAPILGRDFREEEDRPGGDKVVLLGHALWQRRFGGSRDVVGKVVKLNGTPYTVIGVMPPKFAFPEVSQLWTTLQLSPTEQRGNHSYDALARLKPGATIEQARRELVAVSKRLAEQYPVTNAGWTAWVGTLREAELPGDVRAIILLMMGAVGFVLLIACANVANLLLARATARHKEVAIRVALGAGRGRIMSQLLTESVLLALLGSVVGIALAHVGLSLIRSQLPEFLPFWMTFDVDAPVLVFTVLLAITTGVLFGLAPALQASRPNLSETLKEGGRGSTVGARRQYLRSTLVVSEIALASVLLIGATLMVQSFLRMQQVDPGFDRRNLLHLRVYLAGTQYDSAYQRQAFFDQALPRIAALPGVEGVAAINNPPLGGGSNSSWFTVEGRTFKEGELPTAGWRSTTAEYARVMRVSVVRGRYFTDLEVRDTADVAVINETLAKRFWPNDDPIGKRLRFGGDTSLVTNPWLSVIGVVKDVKQRGLDAPPENQFFLPYTQGAYRTMSFMVRTAGDPAAATAAVRGAIRSVDPILPTYDVRTAEAMYQRSYWEPRLYGRMFGTFAAIALLLAAGGVYSVMAYMVSQRSHEIGVRMALGARGPDVVSLVVSHGMKLAGFGLLIGLGLALGVMQLLAGFLFGVKANEPVVFAAIILGLALVALAASVIPARRATRVDPLVALRSE